MKNIIEWSESKDNIDTKRMFFSKYWVLFDENLSDLEKVRSVDWRVIYNWYSETDDAVSAFNAFSKTKLYSDYVQEYEMESFLNECNMDSIRWCINFSELDWYIELGPWNSKFKLIMPTLSWDNLCGKFYYPISSYNSIYYPWESYLWKSMVSPVDNHKKWSPHYLRKFDQHELLENKLYVDRMMDKYLDLEKYHHEMDVYKGNNLSSVAQFDYDLCNDYLNEKVLYTIFWWTLCNLDIPEVLKSFKANFLSRGESYLLAWYPVIASSWIGWMTDEIKKLLAIYWQYESDGSMNEYQSMESYLAKKRIIMGAFNFMWFDTDCLDLEVRSVEDNWVIVIMAWAIVKEWSYLTHNWIEFWEEKGGWYFMPLMYSNKYTDEAFDRYVWYWEWDILRKGWRDWYKIFIAKLWKEKFWEYISRKSEKILSVLWFKSNG